MPAEAWIGHREVPRAEALAEAARLLGGARLAVISGRYGDWRTAAAAARLARRLEAVLDHDHAGAALAELSVMRQGGWLVTTPLEAHAMADTVLTVGSAPDPLPASPPPLAPERPRRLLRLERSGRALLAALGLLRARLKGYSRSGGHALMGAADEGEEIARLAAALNEAHYAVIAWRAGEMGAGEMGAGEMDDLALEMIQGLLEELNAKGRRAFGLPLPIGGGVEGALRAVTAETGLPLRTRLAQGAFAHDPSLHAAERLIASGEADALLYIGAALPAWAAGARAVLLRPPPAEEGAAGDGKGDGKMGPSPAVTLVAGAEGEDTDALLFEPALGALVFRPARRAHARAPAASTLLDDIAAHLDAQREGLSDGQRDRERLPC
jgi:formylmethanofuran dehydrogenase subunit B